MDLDLLPLGWVHLSASLVGLAVGALVLVRPKGTPAHRSRGRVFALAVVITSVTALGIYRSGTFFFAHWFGVASLIVTSVGVVAAHLRMPRAGWIHLHLTCMLASVYILIGGGVNEVFLRVSALRRLAPNVNSPVVGLTQAAVMLLFAALIAYFNVAVLMRARSTPVVPHR